MKKIFILVVIAIPVFFISRWNSSVLEIKKICANANGMRTTEVIEAAKNMKLRSDTVSRNNSIIIHSPRNMGRSICTLSFHDGVVTGAEFSNLD